MPRTRLIATTTPKNGHWTSGVVETRVDGVLVRMWHCLHEHALVKDAKECARDKKARMEAARR